MKHDLNDLGIKRMTTFSNKKIIITEPMISILMRSLANQYIEAIMELREFGLHLNFKQAKYLASIIATMQKSALDEIINTDTNKLELLDTCSRRLATLHKLICEKNERQ